jgi:type II secretory pathway component PulM
MHDMMTLLMRLQELERMSLAARAGHLSPHEKKAVAWGLERLQTMIPETVLKSYHAAKRRDHDLESYPQVMAMAAIVEGFRKATSRQRHALQSKMEPRKVSSFVRPSVRKGAVRAGC